MAPKLDVSCVAMFWGRKVKIRGNRVDKSEEHFWPATTLLVEKLRWCYPVSTQYGIRKTY